MTVRPIDPQEIKDIKVSLVSQEAIKVFNRLISESFENIGYANNGYVKINEAILEIEREMNTSFDEWDKDDLIDRIDYAYSQSGWIVKYDYHTEKGKPIMIFILPK